MPVEALIELPVYIGKGTLFKLEISDLITIRILTKYFRIESQLNRVQVQ